MRRAGIINAALAAGLARLRHTDTLVVADAGLPVPDGPHVIDLALTYGQPSFAVTVRALLAEIVVEASTAAEELPARNPAVWDDLLTLLPEPELVPHEQLKVQTAASRLFVRTGENTPYSNVILRCGVPF